MSVPLEDMVKSVLEWGGQARESVRRAAPLPLEDLRAVLESKRIALADATDPRRREQMKQDVDATQYEITMHPARQAMHDLEVRDRANARRRAIDGQLQVAALQVELENLRAAPAAGGAEAPDERQRKELAKAEANFGAKVNETYEAIRVCMA